MQLFFLPKTEKSGIKTVEFSSKISLTIINKFKNKPFFVILL